MRATVSRGSLLLMVVLSAVAVSGASCQPAGAAPEPVAPTTADAPSGYQQGGDTVPRPRRAGPQVAPEEEEFVIPEQHYNDGIIPEPAPTPPAGPEPAPGPAVPPAGPNG